MTHRNSAEKAAQLEERVEKAEARVKALEEVCALAVEDWDSRTRRVSAKTMRIMCRVMRGEEIK